MQKLKDMYDSLSIENKARAEGVLATVIFLVLFNVIAYFL